MTVRLGWVSCVLMVLCSCQRAREPAPRPAKAPDASAALIAYPQTPYRGVETLNSLVLAGSQILITHRDAVFNVRVMPAPQVARDRASALQKALALQAELERDPSAFERLATRESDDRVSGAVGGYLGTIMPPEMPLELVDAFAALGTGEVSRAVETPQGFHIIKRMPVPEDKPLSLSHIVIKHDAASGWKRADRPVVARDRATARELANKLARELQAEPGAFERYVREHSDADDVVRAGDMGVWSRYEHAEFALLETASRLAEGAISGVVETATGFHILKRTPIAGPSTGAASLIILLHRDAQLPSFDHTRARTKAKAESMARELIAELRQHPERFEQRRIEYCELEICERNDGYVRGRGLAAIEAAVAGLSLHELAADPIDTPLGIAVVRREDPALHPPPAAEPVHFAFDDAPPPVAATDSEPEYSPQQLAEYVLGMERYARSKMHLDAHVSDNTRALLTALAQELSSDTADPEESFNRAEAQLASLLGPDRHEEFSRHRRAWGGIYKASQDAANKR